MFRLAAWTVVLLSSSIVAQTSQITGFASSQLSRAGTIDEQDIGACAAARRRCNGLLRGQANAGGSAYDARDRLLWVSDGATIEAWDHRACRKVCSFKAQLMDATAQVTGLAIQLQKRRLLQLESKFGYVGLRSYDISTCPPNPLRDGCTLRIQSNAIAGGLAYDEARDLVYFTESAPAFVGYITTLHVAPGSNKCNSCKVGLRGCQVAAQGWGPVTGVAYEACTNQLYATDGRRTAVVTMPVPQRCTVTHVRCCDKNLAGGVWQGLAVIPNSDLQPIGQSCLAAGCASCTTVAASWNGGEPVIGNASFALSLIAGPANTAAVAILGARCGTGLPLPFLCGPLYPPLSPLPILSPPITLQGTGCTGTGRIPLPIPAASDLCGLVLCTQWVIACGPVFGVTNGLGIRIGG